MHWMAMLSPPEPPLTDGRIALRPYALHDVPEVTAACQDPEISRWTATIPSPYREEHARAWIASHHLLWEQGQSADFAVVAAEGDELLGSMGLSGFDWESRRAGAGYWVAAWARNRGIATSALRLCSQWALETVGLVTVDLVTMLGNVASERVAQKAGFQLVGEIADYGLGPEQRYHVKRWVLESGGRGAP